MTSLGEPVTRRSFVATSITGAAGAYALADPMLAFSQQRVPIAARDTAFKSGVAAGQVGQRSITLWTQLEGLETPSRLRVDISQDPSFRNVLGRAQALADPGAGGSARVRLTGRRFLRPGEEYYYRFSHRGGSSRVGRFRTALPANSRQPVKLAFFACQDYGVGYYNAHRDLLAQDPDLIIALGDYIYEKNFFLSPLRPLPETPDGQVRTLDEYRNQYRWYNADQDLQDMRASAAFAVIWDDHEVEDNWAGDLPGGASREGRTDIPFLERRANGFRAFFESHPLIREQSEPDRIYGQQRYGQVELFRLDTRQYRTDQPCSPNDAIVGSCGSQQDTNDPNATLTGPPQRQWLINGLKNSTASWKLIANQVMMMSMDILPLPGFVLNTDAWDGYSVERAAIADAIRQNDIKDVSFITGDIHTFFCGRVSRTGRDPRITYWGQRPGPPVATEFVVGSISSDGIGDWGANFIEGIAWELQAAIARAIGQQPPPRTPQPNEPLRNAIAQIADPYLMSINPHFRFANTSYHGYGLVTASAESLKVKFRATHEVRTKNSQPFTLASFTVPRGSTEIYRDAVASARRPKMPVDRSVNVTQADVVNYIEGFLGSH